MTGTPQFIPLLGWSTKFCAPLKIGLRREGQKSKLSARCHKRILARPIWGAQEFTGFHSRARFTQDWERNWFVVLDPDRQHWKL